MEKLHLLTLIPSSRLRLIKNYQQRLIYIFELNGTYAFQDTKGLIRLRPTSPEILAPHISIDQFQANDCSERRFAPFCSPYLTMKRVSSCLPRPDAPSCI